jgi:hypothetical protein
MSRRAASFTQADVARAIRAIKQVDPGPVVVEIAPGGVVRVRSADSIPSSTVPAAPPEVEQDDDLVREPKWRL